LPADRLHTVGQRRAFGWARSLVLAWSRGRGGGALCGANVPRTRPGRPVLLLDFAPQSALPPRPPAWVARHCRVHTCSAREMQASKTQRQGPHRASEGNRLARRPIAALGPPTFSFNSLDLCRKERQGGRSVGQGLSKMRERAAFIGGALTLDSQPGRGTRVRLRWLPVRPSPPFRPRPLNSGGAVC
jgi:hypothetical protein